MPTTQSEFRRILGTAGSDRISLPDVAGNRQMVVAGAGDDVISQRAADFAVIDKKHRDGKNHYNVVLGGEGDKDTYQIDMRLSSEFPKLDFKLFVDNNGTVVVSTNKGVPVVAFGADVEYLQVRSEICPGASYTTLSNGHIDRIDLATLRDIKKGDDKAALVTTGNDGLVTRRFEYAYHSLPFERLAPKSVKHYGRCDR